MVFVWLGLGVITIWVVWSVLVALMRAIIQMSDAFRKPKGPDDPPHQGKKF